MILPTEDGERYELRSPVALPLASGFLWNKNMMIHMNCRGYAVAQHMQPEPAKYAYAPNLEAKTFMQPEQAYYAHHPGRFFYIKDTEKDTLFSVPYEPVRASLDNFVFSLGKNDIRWIAEKDGIKISLKMGLPVEGALELWEFSVENKTSQDKYLSIYPYFPVGYMSWMNQSGYYHSDLNGIICTCVTPYQKYKDYDKIKNFKDKTFLLSDVIPDSWEINQSVFEGEGGLHAPSAIKNETLGKSDAVYETPACIFQHQLHLEANSSQKIRFIFGAAYDKDEVKSIRDYYFNQNGFYKAFEEYEKYMSQGKGCITVKTPDADFDNFVNHWLPRQVYYHGETNRLSTDPQTRNYLQDNMGMGYLNAMYTRQSFVTALAQQKSNGEMPDGILIHEEAILKYINQVPHTDHNVWLPICLKSYLEETGDYDFLELMVDFADSDEKATIEMHINKAMFWLMKRRDDRGLSFIDQGDWCDPMNMVGPEGKGVSGWLTLATAYALNTWAEILTVNKPEAAEKFKNMAAEVNAAANAYLWKGDWYARGITDNNITFGIKDDPEGRIFLNPQAWALLSGAADSEKTTMILDAVEEQLESPYGVELLTPSFTKMRDDIGRVTQKHPGSAENGSVYNHAAAFYIYALYEAGKADKAYEVMRKMIPGPDNEDIKQRGQLPVFIPNYYRGAFKQYPKTAGKSSHLFNTGTVAWVYRSIIDGLFGVNGTKEGIRIVPKLPSAWDSVRITRTFRGAKLNIKIRRDQQISEKEIVVNGEKLDGDVIQITRISLYEVEVKLPS